MYSKVLYKTSAHLKDSIVNDIFIYLQVSYKSFYTQ